MARVLTQNQESFCLAYLKTESASDAYRESHPGSKIKPESVHVAAARLMARPEVRRRIEELRKPAIEAAALTLESHLDELGKIRDEAKAAGQYGPAAAAEASRGKAAGLYKERVEHSGKVTVNVRIGLTGVDNAK